MTRVLPRLLLALFLLVPGAVLPALAADGSVALAQRPGQAAIASAHKLATDAGFEVLDKGGNAGADGNDGGDGPRSTPTCVDGRVFVLDAHLGLSCLDAETGKEVWKRDILAEHDGRLIQWQSAASPLVEGGLVFVAGGGEGQSLLALDAKTGAVRWKALDEKMTHATPVAATIHGRRQVIFFVGKLTP